MKPVIIASAFLAIGTSTSFAADLSGVPVVYDWSGFYVGVDAGYAWDKSRWDNTAINTDYFVFDPQGFDVGLHAGVNKQFEQIVVGVEGDINFGNINSSNDPIVAGGIPTNSYLGYARENTEGSLRARVGFAADRIMPYVTGGIAFANYDYGWKSPPATSYSANQSRMGWTVGGGVEFAASDNITIRAQYLYSDFGSFDRGAYCNDQGGCGYAPYKVNLSTSVASVGVSLKF